MSAAVASMIGRSVWPWFVAALCVVSATRSDIDNTTARTRCRLGYFTSSRDRKEREGSAWHLQLGPRQTHTGAPGAKPSQTAE